MAAALQRDCGMQDLGDGCPFGSRKLGLQNRSYFKLRHYPVVAWHLQKRVAVVSASGRFPAVSITFCVGHIALQHLVTSLGEARDCLGDGENLLR